MGTEFQEGRSRVFAIKTHHTEFNLCYGSAPASIVKSKGQIRNCQINMDENVPELEQRDFFSLRTTFLTFHTFPHTEGKPTSSDGYAPGFLKLP